VSLGQPAQDHFVLERRALKARNKILAIKYKPSLNDLYEHIRAFSAPDGLR